MTVASAGHNPLIFVKKQNKQAELLNPRGIALGLDKGEIFNSVIEEKLIPVEQGDVFVFYTDGVSEAMNPNLECFGEKRLTETINNFSHLSAKNILNKITDSVLTFTDKAPQHDDFTLVVVKAKSPKNE